VVPDEVIHSNGTGRVLGVHVGREGTVLPSSIALLLGLTAVMTGYSCQVYEFSSVAKRDECAETIIQQAARLQHKISVRT